MGKVIAAYGGGFKPPTGGHFQIVKNALEEFPEIDEFIVYVGSKERDGIDQSEAILVWEIYQNYLANKVTIKPSKSPIGDILRLAKDNPQDEVYFIIGYREGRDDDMEDVTSRTSNLKEKYPNIKVITMSTTDANMSGTNARKAIGNEEDFVKFFAARSYEGVLTPKVKAHFTSITSKALKQFLNDQLNERLTKAIDSGETDTPTPEDAEIENTTNGETKVFTTQDELDGYNIVKAILREKVSVKRITGRDTQSYFGVLLDNNNRKPLCRLYFNTNQNYLGTIDENKQVTRHSLESVDDIFNHSEALLRAVDFYET